MQHTIPIESFAADVGPAASGMAEAVSRCVHCGFCLATCPTYAVLGEEMDSPRGRIVLMKEVLEGSLELEPALAHIDPCLGCLACETSCPSGVRYAQLLLPFRAVAARRRRTTARRLLHRLLLGILMRPARLRLALRLAAWARVVLPQRLQGSRFFPRALSAALQLAPPLGERSAARPAAARPSEPPRDGERRGRVALFSGCVPAVLQPTLFDDARAVLQRNGLVVTTVPGTTCCGALAHHAGERALALGAARATLRACRALHVDAILTCAAGCGSTLSDYGGLFAGEPEQAEAEALAARALDATVYLARLGPLGGARLPRPLRAVYHDACHLAHAQREREAPRALLRQVGNLELLEPLDWEICCGSAGTYNLEQPEIARELGERKVRALLATGAELVLSGNVGCTTQIRQHLVRQGRALPVLHPLELLRQAYDGCGER